MSKLYFRYGAMNCGKTTSLLQVAHNYEERGMKVVLIKPSIDTKAENRVSSRIGVERKVDYLVSPDESLKGYLNFVSDNFVSCVLVDEAQFLSREQINQLWFIAHKYNISVICYGLKSNFKGDLFEGSQQLFARSDEKHELTVNCVCGKVAMFNARRVNGKYSASGKEVVIDGVNDEVEYIPLCADGGIVHDHHITLALAMGCDFVMMGRYFARFDESPTTKIKLDGKFVKEYWGEGSKRARSWTRYDLGSKNEKMSFVEGVDSYIPYAGPLKDNLNVTIKKIKSTMSNCGSRNLEEFHEKAILTPVSNLSIQEGSAHDLTVREI